MLNPSTLPCVTLLALNLHLHALLNGHGLHLGTVGDVPKPKRQGCPCNGEGGAKAWGHAACLAFAERAIESRTSRNSGGVAAAAAALPTLGRFSSAFVWFPHQLTSAFDF